MGLLEPPIENVWNKDLQLVRDGLVNFVAVCLEDRHVMGLVVSRALLEAGAALAAACGYVSKELVFELVEQAYDAPPEPLREVAKLDRWKPYEPD